MRSHSQFFFINSYICCIGNKRCAKYEFLLFKISSYFTIFMSNRCAVNYQLPELQKESWREWKSTNQEFPCGHTQEKLYHTQ